MILRPSHENRRSCIMPPQKSSKKQSLPPWEEAKRRHRLTDAQVQMAKELGMNPKSLGKIDNHKQERWKLPLPLFIEECYRKRFRSKKQHEPQSSQPDKPTKVTSSDLDFINRLLAEAAGDVETQNNNCRL
jgi:hypothetical protein